MQFVVTNAPATNNWEAFRWLFVTFAAFGLVEMVIAGMVAFSYR